jgi:hypothetical protein
VSPRISVVVPARDVRSLLAETIGDLEQQDLEDFEVIVVDDGSTDGTVDLVRRTSVRDPRFRLVQTDGIGPGAARNRGIARAEGEFLAFVDGDDRIAPTYLSKLLAACETSGAPLAICDAERFRGRRPMRSILHRRVFKGLPRRGTVHLRRHHQLLYDITVWNKLIHRELWTSAVRSFPEGMLHEDILPTVQAHLAAPAVAVVPEILYRWRIRTSGLPSITQQRRTEQALADRLTAVTSVLDVLSRIGDADLLGAFVRKALEFDLALHLERTPGSSDDYLTLLRAGTERFLTRVGHDRLGSLRADHRAAYELLLSGTGAGLRTFYTHWSRGAVPFELRPTGLVRRRLQLSPPPGTFDEGDRRLLEGVSYARTDLEGRARVLGVVRTPGGLRLGGFAYLDRVAPDGWQGRRSLVLRRRGEGHEHRIELPCTSEEQAVLDRPDLQVDHRSSGFQAELTDASIGGLVAEGPSIWDVHVDFELPRIGTVRVRADVPSALGAGLPARRLPVRGEQVHPYRTIRGNLSLEVAAPGPALRGARSDRGRLVLELALPEGAAADGPRALVFAGDDARHEVALDASTPRGPDGGPVAFVGIDDLVSAGSWELALSHGGRDEPIQHALPSGDEVLRIGSEHLHFGLTARGHVRLYRSDPRTLVEHLSWVDGATLRLAGRASDGPAPRRIAVATPRPTQRIAVDVVWAADGTWTADLEVGGHAGVPPGTYDLEARDESGSTVRLAASVPLLAELPSERDHAGTSIQLQASERGTLELRRELTRSGTEARLAVRPPVVTGAAAASSPRDGAASGRPGATRVVLQAGIGERVGGGLRRLAEELQRLEPELECTWVVASPMVGAGDAASVVKGTMAYHHAVRAAHIVATDGDDLSRVDAPDAGLVVRLFPGVTSRPAVLQAPAREGAARRGPDGRPSPRWDLVVTDGERTAVAFPELEVEAGEVLGLGIPRHDDLLVAPEPGEIRQRLGIADPEAPVRLFAPRTHEDDELGADRFGMELPLASDEVIGELERWRSFLLVRIPPGVTDEVPSELLAHPRVVDVTDEDLSIPVLASDAVATDEPGIALFARQAGRPVAALARHGAPPPGFDDTLATTIISSPDEFRSWLGATTWAADGPSGPATFAGQGRRVGVAARVAEELLTRVRHQ